MATVDRAHLSIFQPRVELPQSRSLPLEKRLGRVLVTGANGFVGSNLTASLLTMGVETVAAVRPGRTLPNEIASRCGEVTYRTIDFQSVPSLVQTLEGVDTIVHSAGRVSARNYREFLETNRNATLHLFEAASRLKKPPRILLISSIAASGPRTGDQVRSTDDRPEPISLYGRSKLAGESVARRFAKQLPITILRPGIIFGPGDHEVLRLIKMIAKTHINFIPGYHRPRFPFIAVQDLVTCIIKAIDVGGILFPSKELNSEGSHQGEGVYFAADSQFLSFAQFGRWVSKSLGQRWELSIPIPLRTLRNAARIHARFLSDPERPSTFSVDKIREAAAKGWECDVSKTMHELSWSPAALLEERLRETIHWYRQHDWI